MSRRRGPWLDHGVAAGVMVLGAGLVFGLLSWMNGAPPPKPPAAEQTTTAMTIAPPKRPPKKDTARQKPKRRPKPTRRAPPRTPPPALASALSGVDLGGALGRQTGGMDAMGDALIGDVDRRSVVMTADTVDERPRPVRRVPPGYPAGARRRGVSGTVIVRMLIDAQGQVEAAKVLRADPPGVFEDAALAAVRQWAWQPARQAGAPVKVWVEQPVRFQMTRGLGG